MTSPKNSTQTQNPNPVPPPETRKPAQKMRACSRSEKRRMGQRPFRMKSKIWEFFSTACVDSVVEPFWAVGISILASRSFLRLSPHLGFGAAAPRSARHGFLSLFSPALFLPAFFLPAFFLLSGCGSSYSDLSVEERLPYIQDENFKIENPSRDEASATGIACAGSDAGALKAAKKTARYNLRGVTGNASYNIRFTLLRELPEKGAFCVEVEAQAVRRPR